MMAATSGRRGGVGRRGAHTLIEAVVVLAVVGALGAGLARYLADAVDVYMIAGEEAELYAETWVAVERMAMELNQAGAVGGAEPVATPARGQTGPELAFNRPSAAVTECPACVDHSTYVTFTLSGGSLWRDTAGAPGKLLADNVTAFSVTASDDPVDRRYYEIRLTRSADPQDASARSVTLTATVFPAGARNAGWRREVM